MKTRMKPVWIKYWGLIPMTRRGYLVTLTVAVAVAAIIVAYCALAGFLPPLRTLWEPDPAAARLGWRGWFYNYMWWMVIVALVAQVIDTILVLRKFTQKEAEQRAAEVAATQASTSASSAPSGSQPQAKA